MMSLSIKTIQNPMLRRFTRNFDSKKFHRWVAPTLKELKRRNDRLGPQAPTRRSEFLEWNYDAEIYAFGKRLGENFTPTILKQALIEQSYINQEIEKQKKVELEPEDIENNLNLADEGEKLIENYVTQYLSLTLPRLPKKYLLTIKDYLVDIETLATVSSHIGINDIILSAEYPLDNEALARNLKSVVQALVLSSGVDRASLFIRDFIVTQLAGKDLTPFCTPENPLVELTEQLEQHNIQLPEPRLIAAVGKNTILASYQVGIYSNQEMIGRGFGESIEIAQDMAACDALWRLWGVTPNKKPFPLKIEFPLKIAEKIKQQNISP